MTYKAYKPGERFKDIGGYEHEVTEVTVDMGSRLDTYYIKYKTIFTNDKGKLETDYFQDEINHKREQLWNM